MEKGKGSVKKRSKEEATSTDSGCASSHLAEPSSPVCSETLQDGTASPLTLPCSDSGYACSSQDNTPTTPAMTLAPILDGVCGDSERKNSDGSGGKESNPDSNATSPASSPRRGFSRLLNMGMGNPLHKIGDRSLASSSDKGSNVRLSMSCPSSPTALYDRNKDARSDGGASPHKRDKRKRFKLPFKVRVIAAQLPEILHPGEPVVLNKGESSSDGGAGDCGSPLGSPSMRGDSTMLSRDLVKFMRRMKAEFMADDGHYVDYRALRDSDLFAEYKAAACKLRNVDLSSMPILERKAFFLNIYNVLTLHGMVYQPKLPASPLECGGFWRRMCYNIGGQVYSLDEIEHGLLRGNKPHRGKVPFKRPDDKRRDYCLPADPRIHFALVCGAKSCPAISVFTAENVDYTLEGAAKGYVSAEVTIKTKKRRLCLPQIFHWFRDDFGGSEQAVVDWLMDYLSPEQLDQMDILKREASSIDIHYIHYNWKLNVLPPKPVEPVVDDSGVSSGNSPTDAVCPDTGLTTTDAPEAGAASPLDAISLASSMADAASAACSLLTASELRGDNDTFSANLSSTSSTGLLWCISDSQPVSSRVKRLPGRNVFSVPDIMMTTGGSPLSSVQVPQDKKERSVSLQGFGLRFGKRSPNTLVPSRGPAINKRVLNLDLSEAAEDAQEPNSPEIMPTCQQLAEELAAFLTLIKESFVTASDREVDYLELVASAMFEGYQKACRQLKYVDLGTLSESERKAFLLNVYNALTLHSKALAAQAAAGPTVLVEGSHDEMSYDIGGLAYSLDDIADGLLRGNRPGSCNDKIPFKDTDLRCYFCLPFDARIHFALFNGEKKGPALRVYTAETVDSTLFQATWDSIQDGVILHPEHNSMEVPSVFLMYQHDFGSSPDAVVRWITDYIDMDQMATLDTMRAEHGGCLRLLCRVPGQ